MGVDLLLKKEMIQSVPVSGMNCPIKYGFKTGIEMDIAYHDKALTKEERIIEMMKLFYGENLGYITDMKEAVDRMLWFYTRGKYVPVEEKEEGPAKSQKKTPREFCFKQDAELILAAFYSSYGIMLNRLDDIDLHWWEFMALFAGLPEDSMIKKYIYYRTCDIGRLSKSEQKTIKSIRAEIRVIDHVEMKNMSNAQKLAMRDQDWLNIARRYKSP